MIIEPFKDCVYEKVMNLTHHTVVLLCLGDKQSNHLDAIKNDVLAIRGTKYYRELQYPFLQLKSIIESPQFVGCYLNYQIHTSIITEMYYHNIEERIHTIYFNQPKTFERRILEAYSELIRNIVLNLIGYFGVRQIGNDFSWYNLESLSVALDKLREKVPNLSTLFNDIKEPIEDQRIQSTECYCSACQFHDKETPTGMCDGHCELNYPNLLEFSKNRENERIIRSYQCQ